MGNFSYDYSVQATIDVSSYPSSQYIILAAQCWSNSSNYYQAVAIDRVNSFDRYCDYTSNTTILIKVASSDSIGASYRIMLYKYA